MKLAVKTVGCKLNQCESRSLAESLERFDWQTVGPGDPADVYIINTCTVTSKADYSSRQSIYRAIRTAEKREAATGFRPLLLVTGCYAQRAKDTLRDIPGVDLVVDNPGKDRIADIVLERFAQGARGDSGAIDRASAPAPQGEAARTPPSYSRGFVKIQDGCDSACSYCIVPAVRGPGRSIPAREIEAEIDSLLKRGFKEIVLTGVHTGKYDDGGMNLAGLLSRLCRKEGEFRIRLSSLEPEEITDELIELIGGASGNNVRICPHFHVALQSASDGMILLMNRSYSSEALRDRIFLLRKKLPDCTIGADVIVGHPGETDGDFEFTRRFVEQSPIDYLHVFSYSDRPGTAASRMAHKIPAQTRAARSRIMRDLGRRKSAEHRAAFLGRELDVLVETSRDRRTGELTGLTDNYLRVNLVASGNGKTGRNAGMKLMRSIVKARITAVLEDRLTGELV